MLGWLKAGPPLCRAERVQEADPGRVRATVGALGMNLEGSGRGGEFGMSSVSCGNGKLRQWLIDQIDSGKYPGLVWENEEKSIFRIPWKHAGKQDYNREEDAALFKVTSTRGAQPRWGWREGPRELGGSLTQTPWRSQYAPGGSQRKGDREGRTGWDEPRRAGGPGASGGNP